MVSLQLEMAADCLWKAMDLSGLLLLYTSLGDAEGIAKLASLAKEQGKNNIAFVCLFVLGKLEDCIQLLIERQLLDYLFIFSMISKHLSSAPNILFLQPSHTRSCFNFSITSSKQSI